MTKAELIDKVVDMEEAVQKKDAHIQALKVGCAGWEAATAHRDKEIEKLRLDVAERDSYIMEVEKVHSELLRDSAEVAESRKTIAGQKDHIRQLESGRAVAVASVCANCDAIKVMEAESEHYARRLDFAEKFIYAMDADDMYNWVRSLADGS